MRLKTGVYTIKSRVTRHDNTTNPMGEELSKLSESNQHARLVSLGLNPLIAPSHVVAAAETSHEAAAAETAADGCIGRDSNGKAPRAVPAPLPSQRCVRKFDVKQ